MTGAEQREQCPELHFASSQQARAEHPGGWHCRATIVPEPTCRKAAEPGPARDEDIRDGILTLPAALAIRDPQTQETYVLVREDFYQHMRKILDSMTRSAGWDDPSMDDYELYRNQP